MKSKFKTMDKYAFRNDLEHINDNLEISDRWHMEIVKTCEISLIEGEGRVTDSIEYALNKLQPKNMVEAMYIGFVLKARIDFQNPLARLGIMLEQAAKNKDSD